MASIFISAVYEEIFLCQCRDRFVCKTAASRRAETVLLTSRNQA